MIPDTNVKIIKGSHGYSEDIKAYARMLYLLVDEETGLQKFSLSKISNKIVEQFGVNKPTIPTIHNWSKKWRREDTECKVLLKIEDTELPRYQEKETYNHVRRNKVVTAIQNQIRTNLLLYSKRMQRYSVLEDKVLRLIEKKNLNKSDLIEIRDRLKCMSVRDIQNGVTESSRTFVTQMELLNTWMEKEEIHNDIVEVKSDEIWEFEPVDIEEFLENEEFLGSIFNSLFPCVVEDIKAIFYGNPRRLLERRRYKEIIFKEAYGSGKCCESATQIMNATTGKISTIGELFDKGFKSFDTWGLNHSTLQVDRVRVVDVVKIGELETYRLRLRSGRHIDATANHKFYSDKGWKQLSEFEDNDFIAIPRKLGDTENRTNLTDDDIYFVGCYLSDGSFRHERRFTKPSSRKLMERMEKIANKNGVSTSHRSYRRGWKDVAFSKKEIEKYFYKLGLADQSEKNLYSHEKFIPDSIMRLSNEKLRIFVNSMILGDGWLEVRTSVGKNRSPQVGLGYCSTSEFMIDQLMTIFQRLGFVARKRGKIPKIKGKEYHRAFEINLYGKQAYELLKDIGPLFGKEDLYNKAISVCKNIEWNANVDLVPFTHEDTLAYNRNQNKYGYQDFKRVYGIKKNSYYSRDKLKRLRDDFGDESLSRLADSDIFWDRVESIEKLPGVQDVYDCVVDSHHHNFIANGIITHNSERAAIMSAYLTYLVLCLRNPLKYFELLPGSKITILNVSVSKKQAKDVVFSKIKSKIDNCSWFRNHGYPYDPNNKLELRFDPADSAKINPDKIYKNVYIIPGSSSEFAALGYDVLCAIIDEATAYGRENGKDRAETIYTVLKGRVSSRFSKAGMIVLAGNPHHIEDFLENRLRDAKDQKDVYIIDRRSIWEARMPDYEGDWFYFDIVRMQEVDEIESVKTTVIKIPVVYYDEFKNAPEMSVRNLAGISLESISRFFTNINKIEDMFVNSGRKNPIREIKGSEVVFEKSFQPVNKGVHAIHIDIGVNNDALGLVLGHIHEYERGLPHFWVDCVIRLKGSQSSPTILEDVRSIIYQLSSIGFNINYVSLDGYQSTDTLQILNRKGYEAFYLSVDKQMAPYINLRQAIYESRINCPVDSFLKYELETLENVNNKKVDHPLKGSKDVSDALCGMIHTLIEKVRVESIMSNNDKRKIVLDSKEKEEKTRTAEEVCDSMFEDFGGDGDNYGDIR